ncbi:MAG: hypothetical protein U1E34_03025 [Amaricoccus sp.]
MRQPTFALLVGLTAAGCATQDPGQTAAGSGSGEAAGAAEIAPAAAPPGGSGPAPYILIGVAIGIGLIVFAISHSAMMPDTSPPA